MFLVGRLSKPLKPTETIQKHLLVSSKLTSISLTNQFLPICRNQSNQTTHCNTHQDSHLISPNQTNQLSKPSFQNSYFLLLKQSNNLHTARKIHGLLLVNGFFEPNALLECQLVNTYVSCDSLQEAILIFNRIPKRTVFAWNSILKGLVNVGQFSETIEFYHLMRREGIIPDNYTYPLVLKACSRINALEQGRRVQELIYFNEIHHKTKPNIFVECAIIDMFAKCGSLNEARQVFEGMLERDLVSWSAMICGTVQNGEWLEALSLFRRMRLEGLQPDSVIVATTLPACGRLGVLQMGTGLQGCAIRSGFECDLYVSNALIDMYCRCGNTREAYRLFHKMACKDVVSWSSLIAGHSQNSEYGESVDLYIEMKESGIRPTPVTIASVLPGFANLQLLKQGKEIHNYVLRHGFESDIFVVSSLIDMYAKCGSMRKAEFFFETMLDGDVSIWNSMITGYDLNGDIDSAFEIMRRFHKSKFRPNSITIMSLLPLCTRLATPRHGKEIHGHATRNGLGSVVSVENSLIDMYCKCGYLELGVQIFEHMVDRDIVTYNTIIAALGMHGHGAEAFMLFNRMKKEKIKPDKLTFIALLSACSHAGLVDKGRWFYNSMIDEYGILPDMEHYSCMVDLLGRSGCLDEAWEFIKTMPLEPGIDVLGSLLGACRVHNKIELAELVGKQIFNINPEDPGYYVLLSNIYAAAGRQADVLKVRTMIKEQGLMKKPGNSWIQVKGRGHLFLARDRSHFEFYKIQVTLMSMLLQMNDEGYIPDTSFFLHDLAGDDN